MSPEKGVDAYRSRFRRGACATFGRTDIGGDSGRVTSTVMRSMGIRGHEARTPDVADSGEWHVRVVDEKRRTRCGPP